MRLEGKAKLGFFPTPPETLRLIPTWLTVAGPGLRRYFDPCAGTGEALARIADAHGPAETYGIELSDLRAVEAKKVLTTTLNTGYEYALITDEVFSLILLNPPYDGEGITGAGPRLEETFLITSTSPLVPGAALVYIVPHARLNNDRIARHLLGWYDNLRCFILPCEEYQAFKQAVVFGSRKPDYKPPTAEQMRVVMEGWAQARVVTGYTEGEVTENGQPKKGRLPVHAPMPALTAGQGEYAIPTCGLHGKHGAAFRFQYQLITDEDMLREADGAAGRLEASREWRDLVPPVEPLVIRPAITPKKGHIAMQVSGGLLGTNLLRSGDGGVMLLKGLVHKRSYVKAVGDVDEVESDDWLPYDDDRKKLKKVEVEQRFENLLTTLDVSGRLETTSDPTTISDLLNQYVGQLTNVLQLRNVPRYDMKPEAWEWAVFDNLSRAVYLPGRTDTGLTDFQKHLAVALGRVCLAYGAGFVMAEMGSGVCHEV